MAAVEAVGAIQAQAWAAPPAALAARVEDFELESFRAALADRRLVTGTLLRGTLHLVSAREHPHYAAVADAVADWRRTKAASDRDTIQAALRAFAAEPRTPAEIAAWAERWVAGRPGSVAAEEIDRQRELGWRPLLRWNGLVRSAADWAKSPRDNVAAPHPPADDLAAALEEVVRRHLRAFGPAAPEDVAYWIGWRVGAVREAMAAMELQEVGDGLLDLPDAPRPAPAADPPPRLLAPFDSVLLAYVPGRRERILPDRHRTAVFEGKNLQVRPTFLVGGRVAGRWSIAATPTRATLTLDPLERVARAALADLRAEAERLVDLLHPHAKARAVAVA